MSLQVPFSEVGKAMVTIETERLRLRTFQPADVETYHAMVYGDAEVMLYLPGGVPRPIELVEDTVAYFIQHQKKHGFSIWAVVEKESNQLVGHGGLIYTPRTDEEPSTEVEIAYAFGKAYWGKGYATEVARASLRYGFEEIGLERIIALAFPANVPSQRVMQKIGMTHLGLTDIYHDAELVMYGMEREEWDINV
jgi:RimJ/RimL family protein N-acetyltransferase